MTRRTVRFRLTAVYTGLFLATTGVVLVSLNLMLKHNLDRNAPRSGDAPVYLNNSAAPMGTAAPGQAPAVPVFGESFKQLSISVQRDQWIVTAIIITVLAVVAVAFGWWLAGRMLRPLHRITSTARRLSLSNLDERIALIGPHDELRELADTFDGMLERLQRAADSQRRFAANASHELRTPLAIQRTAIQVGLDDPSPEQVTRVRDELLDVNRRMEALIDGLLALAWGERGLEAATQLSLDDVVVQAIAETVPNNVEIQSHIEPAIVLGDPVLLTRLAVNLLDNAFRYNLPGGWVDVRVSADRQLTVRNTGREIPPERINELFEPFRRLDTARTGSTNGAGLGLSIVAAIARAHDADLNARPMNGGGLEIAVCFPAVQRPAKDIGPSLATGPSVRRESAIDVAKPASALRKPPPRRLPS